MNNVYENRLEQGLYYILSETIDNRIQTSNLNHELKATKNRIAIIINLYYMEMFDDYFGYIKELNDDIDVYILSSNADYLDMIRNRMKELDKRVVCIQKNNRGRDISALLVASKDFILQYDYICFIHDKKTKKNTLKTFISDWNYNLWNNMLAGKVYVNNIINQFEKEPELGLLTPPEVMAFGCDYWGSNYENTVQLANNLKLNCNISAKCPPITIGTVFWCRTKALNKLLKYNWTYEDFDEEPLGYDGTISHAVERIFAYVAQDAGYYTGTVMTERYSRTMLAQYQDFYYKGSMFLRNRYGVSKTSQLLDFEQNSKELIRYCNRHRELYIYGAGIKGKDAAHFLQTYDYHIAGYLITGKVSEQQMNGIPVNCIEDVDICSDYGIIIAADNQYVAQIQEVLQRKGYHDAIVFWGV